MMPIVYPNMRPFFFGLNEGTLCQSQDWCVSEFMSGFRLTQRGHPFIGFDDIREWLIEQNVAFTIDGVRIYEPNDDGIRINQNLYGSGFVIHPMRNTSYTTSATAVLVLVDERVAPMFKLRWS